MSPKRIQRQRTKGWRMPEGAVYVGRPSRLGNPYSVRPFMGGWSVDSRVRHIDVYETELSARQCAVSEYRALLLASQFVLKPLLGRDLVCWCPEQCGEPVALYGVAYGDLYEPCAKPRGHEGGHDPSISPWCHADVLLELANGGVR